MRLRCWLKGCDCWGSRRSRKFRSPCRRCGADPVGGGAYHWPLAWRVRWWLTTVRRRVFRRCEECRRPMWFDPRPFCSDRCCMTNLPF